MLWVVALTFGLDGLVWDAGLFEHAHALGERFHTHQRLHRAGDEPHQHSREHEHLVGSSELLARALHGAQWTAAAPNQGFLHSHDADYWSGKFFPTNDRERVQMRFDAREGPPSLGRYPVEFQALRSRGPPPRSA